MKGYTTDGGEMLEHVRGYMGYDTPHIIEIPRLRIRMPRQGIVGIASTPHYQYTLGNQQPYKDWLVEHNHLYESSLASFEYIMNNDSDYLEGLHEQDFIVHDSQLVIIDGVHRATRLFQLGVRFAPVLWRAQ